MLLNLSKPSTATRRLSTSTLAALALGLAVYSASGTAWAKPKCDRAAGECKRQDDKKKPPEGYPNCLSTKGGPGCRGQAPDPKLPPGHDITPTLPDGGTDGGDKTHRRSTGR